MSMFADRVMAGSGAAILGGCLFGPLGAYIGWKLAGALVTGNPLYLVPMGGTISDGVLGLAEFADAATLADATDLADGGPNIQGHQGNLDIQGRPPLDGQGNLVGRLGNGELPKDIWNRPT